MKYTSLSFGQFFCFGICLILGACSSITGNGLMPPRFDSVEYSYVTDTQWNLSLVDCQKSPGDKSHWYDASMNLDKVVFFSAGQPNDEAVHDAGQRLYQIINEYLIRDNPSSEYCKLKLESLNKALNSLAHQMAQEPRN